LSCPAASSNGFEETFLLIKIVIKMKNIQNFFYTKKIQIPPLVQIIVGGAAGEGELRSASVMIESKGRSRNFLSKYSASTPGNNALSLPFANDVVLLKGPLGLLELNLKKIDSLGLGFFFVNKKSNELEIYVKKNSKLSKAFFGSLVAFLFNSLNGVSQGFLIYLELTGVGFRAILHERTIRSEALGSDPFILQEIEFKIGQTHDIFYVIPKNIRVFSIKPTLFCLYGIEKTQITQIAAEIRNLKIPDSYKGKGIRYKDEIVNVKVGKKK
jgi:large subunit ribosomal protein L6